MEAKGAVNQYVCPDGHRTTTVNADEGVTPFTIACRTPGCGQRAFSSFYRVPDGAVPRFEWFRPDEAALKTLDEATRDYARGGAMLLREVGAPKGAPVHEAGKAVRGTNRTPPTKKTFW